MQKKKNNPYSASQLTVSQDFSETGLVILCFSQISSNTRCPDAVSIQYGERV